MAYYAKVHNGLVEQVIVADKEFFNSFVDTSPGVWIETSYTGNLQVNYASVGYSYDSDIDEFIPPQDFASWILDDSFTWKAPTPYPTGSVDYTWDEPTTSWVEVTE